MITVGMATYGDWSGVYFTVQALRLYHPEVTEILIIDNKGDDELKQWAKYWGQGIVRYIRFTDIAGTTQSRQKVFEKATKEYVFCVDSHVLIAPDSFSKPFPAGDDLWHGPMMYDDFTYVTHMEPIWQSNMWGVWAEPVRKLASDPFDIPMHGCGLFGCRKSAWLGFNNNFRGFGGEEGYIHEKYRKAGRKVLCLPWLRWCHRFGKSGPYPLNGKDRIRNYVLGFQELGMDLKPISDHFGIRLVGEVLESLARR